MKQKTLGDALDRAERLARELNDLLASIRATVDEMEGDHVPILSAAITDGSPSMTLWAHLQLLGVDRFNASTIRITAGCPTSLRKASVMKEALAALVADGKIRHVGVRADGAPGRAPLEYELVQRNADNGVWFVGHIGQHGAKTPGRGL